MASRKSTDSRKWCFTQALNGRENLHPPVFDPETMHYLIYQTEEAVGGLLHWQGYVSFKSNHKLPAVKRMLGSTDVHCEPARNPLKAIAYCKKADTRVAGPFEFGREPRQGKPNTFQDACDLVQGGHGISSVATQFPQVFVKYHRGLEALSAALFPASRVPARKVFVISGAPGVGKTHVVNTFFPIGSVYTVFQAGRTPWFDGYQPTVHKVVLFDDYCKESRLQLQLHKNVTDTWPCTLPIKGGSLPFQSGIVIFTSNELPLEWYSDLTAIHQIACERRYTKVWTPGHATQHDDPIWDDIRSSFASAWAENYPAPAPIEIPDDAVPVQPVRALPSVAVDSDSDVEIVRPYPLSDVD